MEKYSQFRDKGSGIAPFFPVKVEFSYAYLPLQLLLFIIRLPILLSLSLSYFLILQWLPIGAFGKKAFLWLILGTPGIWWIDLQIDGVKKGSLARHKSRLPQPGSIIACSFTSPLDALYLAAIFDPIFTASYPALRQVEQISLLSAILRAFQPPKLLPDKGARLLDVDALLSANTHQPVVVFPECTTTNGRGILPFSPSLLAAPATTEIFPINLRYTAPDVTTPVPHLYFSFLWNLLSEPTHCIRVRIAESLYNQKTSKDAVVRDERQSSSDTLLGSEDGDSMTASERRVLDKVADALARLGRSKRVGLRAKDKVAFLRAYK